MIVIQKKYLWCPKFVWTHQKDIWKAEIKLKWLCWSYNKKTSWKYVNPLVAPDGRCIICHSVYHKDLTEEYIKYFSLECNYARSNKDIWK